MNEPVSTTPKTVGASMVTTDEWKVIAHQAKVLAESGIVPKSYRGRPHDIVAAALLGREVGMSPMLSLQYIHVVDGKPSMSAEAMTALVRGAGHTIKCVQLDDAGAIVEGIRADTGDTMRFEFSRDHARIAGLSTKHVWKAYFRSMAWARAVSQLCRSLFPDVLMGISYSIEEAAAIGGREVEVDAAGNAIGVLEQGTTVTTVTTEPVIVTEASVDATPATPATVEPVKRRRRCAGDDRCTTCDGYGAGVDPTQTCPTCDGSGRTPEPEPPVTSRPIDPAEHGECDKCVNGYITTPNGTLTVCWQCGGNYREHHTPTEVTP